MASAVASVVPDSRQRSPEEKAAPVCKSPQLNSQDRNDNCDSRTSDFPISQRVPYDNAPAFSATPISTEPFGIKCQNLDVDLRLIPRSASVAGLGSSSVKENRALRIFNGATEHITRLTVDSVGTRWFSHFSGVTSR